MAAFTHLATHIYPTHDYLALLVPDTVADGGTPTESKADPAPAAKCERKTDSVITLPPFEACLHQFGQAT